MKTYFLLIALFIGTFTISAQDIFTIDGEGVSISDFKRMYEKSQAPDSEKYAPESIDEYLNLFVNYKLKLREAKELGLYEDPELLREIAMYEEQLVRGEFDKKVMNRLMNEVEQRLQEEVCVRHILIDVPSRYLGSRDTIYSYNKALKIRKELIAGANFEYLAKKNSADMNTKFSGGDLGCFTTLQLKNYTLENNAFTMQRGEISMPVRSDLGYHIIEVTDRRPSNGLVSATQLFVRSNNIIDEKERYRAKTIIDSAYSKLRSGQEFDDVARWLKSRDGVQTSVDEIPDFMVGSYEKEFENAIFDLNQVGDYSRPTQTSLGWHIFQLKGKKPLPNFEEIKPTMRDKITEDERYIKARINFGSELKRKYQFEKVDSVVNRFAKDVAPGISIENWLTPSAFDYGQTFFKIEDRVYTALQFVNYVREQHGLDRYTSFKDYYNEFETNHLIDYHKHHLVSSDPEMAALMKEFKDGIILFNMMEKEEWREVGSNDERVREHYETLKKKFKNPDKVQVKKYTIGSKKGADKLYELLASGKGKSSLKKIQKKFGYQLSQEVLSEKEATTGGANFMSIGEMSMNPNGGGYEILVSEKIIKGKQASFDEVSNDVLKDYQRSEEEKWINSLKKKYPIVINEKVVESLYN